MTKELTNWYKKYHSNNNNLIRFMSLFNQPNNDKAFVMLTGEDKLKRDSHPFYLWRFNKNWSSRDEILRRIRATQLWNCNFNTFNSFEDLYDFVWNNLNNPKISQIGQLVIYDISVHLAYKEGSLRLMPKDKVYIHALPKRAFGVLVKNNIVKGIKPSVDTIPYSQMASQFKGISAAEIENLFCYTGKSIRRVKGGKAAKTTEESDIDSIVNKYITIF